MAPLTWRNVDAPNFGSAAAMLQAAERSFGNAGAGIGGALTGLGDLQQTNKSAAALPILAKVANEQGVDAAISQIEAQVAPHNRSPELLAAMAALRGETLGYDQTRANTGLTQANTSRVRGVEGRDADKYSTDVARDRALAGMTGKLVDAQTRAFNEEDPFAGLAPASLLTTESGGNYRAKNDATGAGGLTGHFGRVQAGQARIQDAKNAGVLPADMSPEEFLNNDKAQEAFEKWHFGDIQNAIDKNGLDKFIGQSFGDTPITRDGLVAVAHLGGINGMKRFVESGGVYDPKDANGTHLSDYAKTHAGNTTGPAGAGPRAESLIPAGNTLIRPDDILPTITKLGETFNAQRTSNDANRDRDRTFDLSVVDRGRADAEFGRGEEARLINEAADVWLDRNRNTFNRGQAEARNAILNDGSIQDPRVRDALLARIDQDYEKNASFYQPQGLPSPEVSRVDQAMERVLQDIGTFADAGTLEDQGALAEALGTGSQGGGAGGPGAEGGVPNAPDLAGSVAQVESRLKGAGVDMSSPKIVSLVNEMQDKYGLSRDVIMRGMLNRMEEGFFPGWVPFVGSDGEVDEDRLDAFLAKLNPAEIRRDEVKRRDRRDIFSSVATGKAEYLLLRNELEQIRVHQTPGSEKREKELLAQMEKIQKSLVGAVDKLDKSYGGNTGPTQSAAPSPAFRSTLPRGGSAVEIDRYLLDALTK